MPEEEEETNDNVISTGQHELDKKMGGGIPVSSACLVEGPNDSGKSVLLQQLLYGTLEQKQNSTYFTSESTNRELISQMNSLNLDILDYYLFGYVKILTTNIDGVDWDEHTSSQFLSILKNYMNTSDSTVFFIDSLTNFITHATENDILGFFSQIKSVTKKGKTVIVSAHPHAFTTELLTRIISICDVHLTLRTKSMGTKIAHMMEVSKIRGASKATGNIIGFQIEPGFGFRIVPISEVKL